MNRIIRILLVEDNHGDIDLVREALRDFAPRVQLHVAENGIDALECVRDRRSRPHLIVLDLNIPGKSGYDVLRELKEDPELCELPVVIFTSSTAQKDVHTAYRLHANSFVRKPVDLDEFFAVIGSLQRFWVETAILPA